MIGTESGTLWPVSVWEHGGVGALRPQAEGGCERRANDEDDCAVHALVRLCRPALTEDSDPESFTNFVEVFAAIVRHAQGLADPF